MQQQHVPTDKWYQKTWLVIILCILFFPVGLYALWKNSSIANGWKWGVTGFFALVLIAIITADPPKIDPNNAVVENTKPGPAEKYELAEVKKSTGDITCYVVIDDMYSREALIEKARQLREEHQPEGNFTCRFYYKKYAAKIAPLAGIVYPIECGSLCQDKDKDGTSLDFAFYNIEKPAADTLRALKFDTAGYKQEVAFFWLGGKYILLSSATARSLLVIHKTTWYHPIPMVKKMVEGEERFYDPEHEGEYFVIKREQGVIDYYARGELDVQHVIEE